MIDYERMVRECECGRKPLVKEIASGQGESSFIIRCKYCNKSVIYSFYDEGYYKSAVKEWNKFTRLSLNPIQTYCNILFKNGVDFNKDKTINVLIEKFKINKNDAKLYCDKYVWSKVFMLNCDFFKYRYTGMLAVDYLPIVQEHHQLSSNVIEKYHNNWLLNMEDTNGRYLEEGIDYSKKQAKEKKKIWTIFEKS